MKIPLWLIALLMVGYSIWAVRYWHCYRCGTCSDESTTTAAAQQTSGEPLFQWAAEKPVEDPKFATWKKNLLGRGGQGDTLLITGWYRSGEPEGLGLARANALKAMMAPEIPPSRIHVAAKMVTDSLSASSAPMPSADFAWSKMVLKKEEGAIIETDNDVIFLFPFNSTEHDRDAKVEAYLKQLVEKHKGSAATFTIVGHTDDVGDSEGNRKMGLGRAKSIAKLLQSYGIAADRIKADSKGEDEPVADNKTDDGRHQNRRVVLTVNR